MVPLVAVTMGPRAAAPEARGRKGQRRGASRPRYTGRPGVGKWFVDDFTPVLKILGVSISPVRIRLDSEGETGLILCRRGKIR